MSDGLLVGAHRGCPRNNRGCWNDTISSFASEMSLFSVKSPIPVVEEAMIEELQRSKMESYHKSI